MSADILGTNCDQYLSMVQTAEFQEGEEEEDDAARASCVCRLTY